MWLVSIRLLHMTTLLGHPHPLLETASSPSSIQPASSSVFCLRAHMERSGPSRVLLSPKSIRLIPIHSSSHSENTAGSIPTGTRPVQRDLWDVLWQPSSKSKTFYRTFKHPSAGWILEFDGQITYFPDQHQVLMDCIRTQVRCQFWNDSSKLISVEDIFVMCSSPYSFLF